MKIGDKVLCVDDSINPNMLTDMAFHLIFPNWVKKNEIYTVRDIFDNNGIIASILVEELRNAIIYIDILQVTREAAFRINRFREIDDSMDTAISELFDQVIVETL